MSILIKGKRVTATDYVVGTPQGNDRKRKEALFRQWPNLRHWKGRHKHSG
ncbi:MAG: hypothetical protein ABSE16_05535 [Verrucomicrobiota bacterium]|jgi:hypothetical protein